MKKRGSILIAVLIIFIMIAAISLAVVQRAIHGAGMTIDTRKSFVSYQNADSSTEEFLDKLRKFDSDNTGYIPENMDIANFCNENTWICTPSSGKVKDIQYIQEKGNETTSTRAVKAPILPRLNNAITDLKVESCNCDNDATGSPRSIDGTLVTCGDGACNQSNVLISWTLANNADVAGFEIRRGENGKSALNEGSWDRVCLIDGISDGSSHDPTTTPACSDLHTIASANYYYTVLDNADIVESGKEYYFTIKEKNARNFELDSLYNDPVLFTAFDTESTQNLNVGTKQYDCDRDQKHTGSSLYNFNHPGHDWGDKDVNNGCATYNPGPGDAKIKPANFPYNCPGSGSDSMECYAISENGWRPNGRTDYNSGPVDHSINVKPDAIAFDEHTNQCAIQMHGNTTTDVTNGIAASNGTSDSGYCGEKQDAFDSANLDNLDDISPAGSYTKSYPTGVEEKKDDCGRPYATNGYCTSAPTSIASQYPEFLGGSTWSLSNSQNVYNGGSSGSNETYKPRCSTHNCPTQPTFSVCKTSLVDGALNIPGTGAGANVSSWAITGNCTTPTCGPYSASFSCNPVCNSGYVTDKAGSKTSPDGKVTVSYSGTCCRQRPCPSVTSCSDSGYDCGSRYYSEVECGDCTLTDTCHDYISCSYSCSPCTTSCSGTPSVCATTCSTCSYNTCSSSC